MSFLWIPWTGVTAPGTSACPDNKVARFVLSGMDSKMPTLIQNASTGRKFARLRTKPGSFRSRACSGCRGEAVLCNGTFFTIPFICRVCDSALANNFATLAANLKKPAVVVV